MAIRVRAALLLPLCLAACGGAKETAAPSHPVARITITPTGNARADAEAYLKQLCPKPIGGDLNFMVWEGYTDSSFTAPFERACGVKVNATFMGSSDDLVAKLRGGGAQTIDLIRRVAMPSRKSCRPGSPRRSTWRASRASTSSWRASATSTSPRKTGRSTASRGPSAPIHSIYDSTKVVPAPASWSVLWDDKYKGKISLQDDIASVYMVAQYLGMDDPADKSKLYNLSDEQLAKVKAKLLELKPRVRKYWSTAGDLTQLFQSGEVVLGEGWPLMTHQLRKAKFPAAEVIPKEGTTAWADHWVLTNGAQNLDAAYAWLEYAAQPFTHKMLADVTGYIVANPSAKTYMSPDEQSAQHDVGEYGAKVNFWQWGSRRDKYQEIWNEVKAAQ